jgi:hypothetical protein
MLVYKYGCRRPSHRDIAIIRDQIYRANRYRNNLIALELARRAARDFGSTPEEIKVARSEESRALRAALLDDRGALGSGTYLLVEADVQRAAKERTPRFRGCDGSGRIGATIPTARAQKPVVGVWSAAFRLEGSGVYRVAHISLGRGLRVSLPIKIHRPLPDGVAIIGCTIHVDRIGDRWVYSLGVTIDAEPAAVPTGVGACAINFGWRRMPSGSVRVATCTGEDGTTRYLELPASLIGVAAHRESLRSLADQHADVFLGDTRRRIRARRRELLDAAHRGPQRELAQKPFDPLVAWRDDPEHREHWARRDRHLYQWERDEEGRYLRRRREIYRLWAREIAKIYAGVRVEAFALKAVLERATFADLPLPDKKLAERANRMRFLVGPSYLRQEIKGVFGEACELVFMRSATKTCHACGWKCKFDAARQLEHICEHCGAAWDQDVNNTENQLAATAAE